MRSGQSDAIPSEPHQSDDDSALLGLIGVEAFQHSARLAGLCGGILLVLVGAIAWLGTSATRLDLYWLTWAVSPALMATIAGPLLGHRLLSRHALNRWRLFLLALMAISSSAWVFAAVVAVTEQPPLFTVLVVAWLALSAGLVPSTAWLPGLALQLLLQLGFTVGFSMLNDAGVERGLLLLGLWVSLVFIAFTAGLYARREQRARGDVHYLRIETSELQKQLDGDREKLEKAAESRQTLEAELAEILNLAEDASRAKTEFLATMSHEIRTPLNGILPILEMLQETEMDREQQRLVRTAQGSSRHLLRIINDILDFAKVESGKLELEAIEIDVRELVGSVSELMRGSARNQGLKLSVRVAENVPEVVRGDPIRLRQVLINLVSNAIKFTEEGGIRIEVSRGQRSQKEVELLFAVADTGVGMSPEATDHLFQLFTQVDASTTRKHGGTGLGLGICKRLVELMGGKIGVRSAPGQGSTFWFLVPLRKSVTEVPSARHDLKGIRILSLIEDETMAKRVSEHLAAWGVSEESASGEHEVLAIIRSTAMLGQSWGFDLVLIDGNGMESRLAELLADIRAIESLRKLQLVIALRSESLAQRIKRDYDVFVLGDDLRPEPLRRLLHRLFDVESRKYGTQSLKPEEVYDDLNLAAADLAPVPVEPLKPIGRDAPRVLLVEDNPVNQGVVGKALSLLGMDCDMAENGKDAVERCHLVHFDLIFMDCQMPVMDGYEAAGEIRRWEHANRITRTPIVAMTANAMAGDREKCLQAGMDDYLAKPVSMAQLKGCLESWLPSASTSPRSGDLAVSSVVPEEVKEEPMVVLDDTVLEELREVMQEDYVGLLMTYVGNSPDLVEELRQATARQDIEAMVIPMHSLKSSSANVGAVAVSELARQGEAYARAGDLGAASRVVPELEKAFATALRALREHISDYQAG